MAVKSDGDGETKPAPPVETRRGDRRDLVGNPEVLHGSTLVFLQIYSILVSVLGAAGVIWLLAASPYIMATPGPSSSTDSIAPGALRQDSASLDQPAPGSSGESTTAPQASEQPVVSMVTILLYTLLTMSAAGLSGAGLCNLRGIFVYGEVGGGFPRRFQPPYVLRPIIGALNGLFLFFLGTMVVSSLDTSNETWATFPGRLPYVGVAFLAGYASQEFLERLKAAAEALFSSSARAEEIKLRWASATSSPSSNATDDVAARASDNGT